MLTKLQFNDACSGRMHAPGYRTDTGRPTTRADIRADKKAYFDKRDNKVDRVAIKIIDAPKVGQPHAPAYRPDTGRSTTRADIEADKKAYYKSKDGKANLMCVDGKLVIEEEEEEEESYIDKMLKDFREPLVNNPYKFIFDKNIADIEEKIKDFNNLSYFEQQGVKAILRAKQNILANEAIANYVIPSNRLELALACIPIPNAKTLSKAAKLAKLETAINKFKVCHKKIAQVLKETANNNKHFTSSVKLNHTEALVAAERFLGKGYKEVGVNEGVFISADKLRRFRMDKNSLEGNHNPWVQHVHFEYLKPCGKKAKKNNHVILEGK